MAFAGVDGLRMYEGNDVMAGLMSNTNLLWTGFYLPPAPSQPSTTWMSHLGDLREMNAGRGVAPLSSASSTRRVSAPTFSPPARAEVTPCWPLSLPTGPASRRRARSPGSRAYISTSRSGGIYRRTFTPTWTHGVK